MKKLLFIVNVDWFFISHRLPIALAAVKQGFEVHIACAVTGDIEILKKNGIIVHPISLSRSGINISSEFKAFKQLFSAIKLVEPDIIHSVTIKPVLYGNIAARLLGVPARIVSISGLGYVFIGVGLKTKLLRLLVSASYRLALGGAKAVIFQNEADRNTLRKLGATRRIQEVLIRGSGVALENYVVVEEPTAAPTVMLVARLLVDKGVEEFVAAAKLLKSNRPEIRMVLVGDIDKQNPKSITAGRLMEWVNDNTIEHWGYRVNIAETMGKANIIVLPSYREGLPKSLIEAAACGRAVITTDVPGCRDAIDANVTGLLVPVKTVKPLADAILRLVDDIELRHSFALAGRMLAKEAFDIKDVVQKHMEIYSN